MPNVQDEPRPSPARPVRLGARNVTVVWLIFHGTYEWQDIATRRRK